MTENCKTLSFEFFPPNTDSTMLTLIDLAKEFESIPAKYFSITFSGRGSAQKETFNTVESSLIQQRYQLLQRYRGLD